MTDPTLIPTSILCIEPDSGFRCLLSFLILDDLLHRVSHTLSHPRLPARHVFDLIGGEGSGGIVALLAGRLGLSRASAPNLLQQMMPKFCPWGGVERGTDGTHRRHPFVTELTQPMFCRLDEETVPRGDSTFYSRDCVRTCVLANLEGMPQARTFSQRLKNWVQKLRTKARVLPIKLYSRLKLGKVYTNIFFSNEKVTNPTFSGPEPRALKERFRTYDPTLSRPNVYISDVAQATFTHDNLVSPKTINGRRYANKRPSADAIHDIIDEANALFPDQKLGVVVRIGGKKIEDLGAMQMRRGEGEETDFLERVPGRDVFQIELPVVPYTIELIDDPAKVYEVFDAWCRKAEVGEMLDRCAAALGRTVDARAKMFPGDVVRDCA